MQKEGNKLLIIGAGGHGKVVADIANKTGMYSEIAFLDDDETITVVGRYLCEGTVERLKTESKQTEVIVTIGNAAIRRKVSNLVEAEGFKMPVLVHPNAVLGEEVELGSGTVVMAGAVINSGAKLGKGVIVNTSSSVDHDCIVEDYVHVAVGAHVAGTVCIGENCWIGAGAVISNNVSIVSDVVVGAGGVVVKDIREAGTYVGVPAKRK